METLEEIKKEFESIFCYPDDPDFINDYIPSKELWDWISNRLKKSVREEVSEKTQDLIFEKLEKEFAEVINKNSGEDNAGR